LLGALLYFISTAALASRCFGGLRPAARLAAAALLALAVPILVLATAARLGFNAAPGLVLAAHGSLWIIAALWRPRHVPSHRPPEDSVLPAAFLASIIALLSSLLGRDPGHLVLVDAWAHLAWSRTLAASLHAYAPGFPAFLATLTPFSALVGAFRCSALVLHFALTAQFLALGSRGSGRGLAALAALVYLLAPAAGPRFEPPGPELLSAVLLAGAWWVACTGGISDRGRATALGALVLAVLTCHVSALEIANLAGLAIALAFGASGGRPAARIAALGSLAAGGLCAAALSPWFVDLVVSPVSVPLVALQPGAVGVLPLRALAAALGLALGGLLALGAVCVLREWQALAVRNLAVLAGLGLAALLLLAPIALAALGVQVPLQLFTDRLLMAAALPLALLAAVMLDRGPSAAAGRRFVPALGVGVVALAQVVRPVAAWSHIALALLTSVLAFAIMHSLSRRTRIIATGATLALSLVARLLIWTPQVPPEAHWLRNARAGVPVLTNWPVTNELDALVSARVLDGLAGRDANLALHRSLFSTDLRDRLAWCGGSRDVEGLEAYLDTNGIAEAYLVVDDRFDNAWSTYRTQWEAVLASPRPGTDRLLSEPPCSTPAAERLAAMRASMRDWPRAEVAFEAPGVTVFHVRKPIGG
jgi:hypothetical protein